MPAANQNRTMKEAEACLWMRGSKVELLTAAPAAGSTATPGPRKFRMVLYTGAVFANHWRWGNCILDVKGFDPTRPDVPALEEHDRSLVAGYTDELVTKGGEIIATGILLEGDAETEPSAARIRSRLDQKYPYQSSGYWVPLQVEEVQPGVKATVNGESVNGPCTIFRKFNLREASFCTLGWDEESQAVAAGANQDRILTVAVLGAEPNPKGTTMPDPTKPALITQLQSAFGPEKAIALFTAQPNATGLEAFTTQLVEELTGLRTKLTTTEGEVATLKTSEATLKVQLAAAQKAPAVITMAGDPEKPVIPAGADAAVIAALPEGPDKWAKQFATDKGVQAQFSSAEHYAMYKKNESRIVITGASA
jgi:hypothetical protein